MNGVDVLARAGIALTIMLGGLGFYRLYNHKVMLRTGRLLRDLGPLRPMAYTLVYFTMPACVPCRTVQRPAIERLCCLLGDALQVVEFDVTRHPELADRWGVLSVPTTFIIAPNGQVRFINHGIARFERLTAQVQGIVP
jgi:thiol-disulfide isomerase/thioredoxin